MQIVVGVAVGVMALLSPAAAQLSERPGTSADTTLGAKDVSGRSIKDRRVRVIHTTDPAIEGGSRFLQEVDPWLAYQRGKNLTQREFQAQDGVFGRAGLFLDPKLLGDRVTPRFGRDHVSSCGTCHNVPFRDGGAGITFAKGGGEGRNTPHFFGAGLIEMLGLQTRLKVLQACDPARRGFVSRADAPSKPVLIAPMPGRPPIDYGRCGDRDGDGRPDLNNIFRVWYVDESGRRVLIDGNGDGRIDLHDPTVAGYNLEMMVFGWGETEGAMAPTVRVFFTDPIDAHTGMQAFDPTMQFDDGAHGDGAPGDGLAGVSNAGARQFAIHAPADRGIRVSEQGLSLDDPDGDGVINEISEGDVDLAEWYMLHAPAPAVGPQSAETRRGRALMDAWRCTSCHTPAWSIHEADPTNVDPYRRYDGDRRFFDLVVEHWGATNRLEGTLISLADRQGARMVPRRRAATVRELYSDLRHHEMGDAFAETLFNGSRVTRFRTAPLWGVGTSAPYGHDGASLTLDAVIRRHGGEARDAAARYRGAAPKDREALLAFLRSLVLYQTDRLPTDMDGDGRIAPHFMVAGRDTGEERFNPEWLFRTPCEIEGPIRAPDGSTLTSSACLNVATAYGDTLAALRDRDQDGFPDVADRCPEVPGGQNSCGSEPPSGGPRAIRASFGPAGRVLAIDPQRPSIVYAGATDGGGVTLSRDGGATWGAVNSGLGSLHVTALAVDPAAPMTVYAGTARGVFRTVDQGGSWLGRNTGLDDLRIFAVAVDPRSPATIYAGGFGGRISVSTDRGESWTTTRVGSPVYRVTALLADPGDSSVPALDNQLPSIYAGTSGGGVFRSMDQGRTWIAIGPAGSTVFALARDPRVPATLYAGAAEGLYRSADHGAHWQLLAGGPTLPVLALAVNPFDSSVHVGTSEGLMIGLDAGRRWVPDPGGRPAPVVSLAFDPWNPGILYTAEFGGQVRRLDRLDRSSPSE